MTRRTFSRLDVETRSTDDLRAVEKFFDTDRLRAKFRSLLTEVRAELLVREKSKAGARGASGAT